MDYFFYGTLMDCEVLARVIGRHPRAVHLRPAVIDGFRTYRRRGATYPLLVAEPAARTEGRLFQGASGAEAARLRRFEGREYVLRRFVVNDETGASQLCHVFVPAPALRAAAAELWDFEGWRQHHKAAYLERFTPIRNHSDGAGRGAPSGVSRGA